MRYFIGIDISKFKHTAAVIDQDGVVHIKPFDFDNDIIGFNFFFLLLFLPLFRMISSSAWKILALCRQSSKVSLIQES